MYRSVLLALSCLYALSGDGSDHVVIAPADEPGPAMQIQGVVYKSDGNTPVAGAEVYVYHTDQKGHYTRGNRNASKPRLHGTMITDEMGRFSFRTVKPGPYPASSIAAHVHMEVSVAGGSKQGFELHFAGDPYLSSAQEKEAERAERFAQTVKLVADAQKVLQGTWNIRLR